MDAQCSKMKFVREEHYIGKLRGGEGSGIMQEPLLSTLRMLCGAGAVGLVDKGGMSSESGREMSPQLKVI